MAFDRLWRTVLLVQVKEKVIVIGAFLNQF